VGDAPRRGNATGRVCASTGVTSGVVVLLAVLAVAFAGGGLWQRRNGRMRGPGRPLRAAAAGGAEAARAARVTGEDLGQPLGERATLVQFSSAFCAPCRATRRILAEVAQMAEGVAHVEIDAESHLDLVRSLGVMRTPTVLVTDAEGRIVKRASGQPRKPEVIAALGEAVR
jgi:thiol-disulfide isomerase/thioredoxin